MNKNSSFFFLSLFFVFISCYSFTPLEKKDIDTESEYHKNGKLKFQATYENNLLHGKVTNWDRKGDITSTVSYSYGKLHGKWTRFYESSVIMHEVNYNYDKKHGYEIWYYENGNMRSKALYQHGTLIDGPYKWDINGIQIL